MNDDQRGCAFLLRQKITAPVFGAGRIEMMAEWKVCEGE